MNSNPSHIPVSRDLESKVSGFVDAKTPDVQE
jgi:hypothetical protein